eukprot:Unigene198_Nuclearia_a/m.724 Unigene198_Nuclearia_a/g.724  ORF Unigene198_Nuclearia_a/g.724 Unigene198_Nuclearia_a/m.724 type:complete len:554 (-) Unigene198_Nuclearia_a:1634-3295(-)
MQVLDQLPAHHDGARERAVVEEVALAPLRRLAVVHERLVHVEQADVVTLLGVESAVLHLGLAAHLGRQHKHVLHGQHRRNRHDFLAASKLLRAEQHFGDERFERELGHLDAEGHGQLHLLVNRADGVKDLERADHELGWRRRHKVKPSDVVNPERLELQHDRHEVAALNLGHSRRPHALKLLLRVQPVRLAGPHAPRAAGALLRGCLRCRRDDERLDVGLEVVHTHLDEAAVDHVYDAVDRNGRLGNVGRHNDLAVPARHGLKDALLLVVRQTGVDWHWVQQHAALLQRRVGVAKLLHQRLDLVLPGQEHEYVTRRLVRVDVEDRVQRCAHVAHAGLLEVVDVDRVHAPLDGQDCDLVLAVVAAEIGRKLVRVERGGRDDEAQVGPLLEHFFQQPDDHIRVHRALVRLVQHERAVLQQQRVEHHLAQEHAVGHVLDARAPGRPRVVEADREPDLLPKLDTHLARHALRDRRRRHAPRLRAPDHAPGRAPPGLEQILRDLRRLAAAGRALDDRDLVLLDRVQDAVLVRRDRQVARQVVDVHRRRVLVRQRVCNV